MIGYMQLYFKIIGEKETYYASFDGDFGKPITRLRLWSIKRSIKRLYEKFDNIYSVDFCCKGDFEQNRSGDEIHLHWNDEDGG